MKMPQFSPSMMLVVGLGMILICRAPNHNKGHPHGMPDERLYYRAKHTKVDSTLALSVMDCREINEQSENGPSGQPHSGSGGQSQAAPEEHSQGGDDGHSQDESDGQSLNGCDRQSNGGPDEPSQDESDTDDLPDPAQYSARRLLPGSAQGKGFKIAFTIFLHLLHLLQQLQMRAPLQLQDTLFSLVSSAILIF